MKVLILGASGKYGSEIAKILAKNANIESLTLVSRSLESLQNLASRLDGKADVVERDVSDRNALTDILPGHDVLVNCTGHYEQHLELVLRASIEAGVNYTDLSESREDAMIAFRLDGLAKERGVTAIHGVGSTPGAVNLLAVSAAKQLDSVDGLYAGFVVAGGALLPNSETVAAMRKQGKISAVQETMFTSAAGKIAVLQNGSVREVDPITSSINVPLPSGYTARVYPLNMSLCITLARVFPKLKNGGAYMGFLPDEVNHILRKAGMDYSIKKLDLKEAVLGAFEQIASGAPDLFTLPQGAPGYIQWALAEGIKNGDRSRCVAVLGKRMGVEAAATAAALALASGGVNKTGVLSIEEAFEPIEFFNNVSEIMYGEPFGKGDLTFQIKRC